VELSLAYLSTRLAKKDIVIGVGVKRRIEIDKIDTGVGKFFPVENPFQIVAEIEAVHLEETIRDSSTSLGMTSGCNVTLLADIEAVHRFTLRFYQILG
jgi:hypothetical protein